MLATMVLLRKKSTTKVYTAKCVCVCVKGLIAFAILVGRNRKSENSTINWFINSVTINILIFSDT